MKPSLFKKLIKTLLCLSVLINTAQAQTISLPREWKFKIGDNPEWANPTFDVSSWDTKFIGKSWSVTGQKQDVYAWYRVKITIPSSLKTASKGQGIKLNLGKIDDVDFTYLNGKLIGQMGSFPPQYETKWSEERIYSIAEKDVLWDAENVIAVRIYSLVGGVGLYEGAYTISPIQWSDFITVEKTIVETANHGFKTQIKFTNKSENGFEGTIKYAVKDKSGKALFEETKPVQVSPKKGAETTIVLPNYQPKNDEMLKVGYQIVENSTPATVSYEQLYLANNEIKIPVGQEVKPLIDNKIKDIYTPIAFQNQELQGYLGTRLKQNLEQRLLKVDEEGLTGSYLTRPGIHPWAGEHVGKYLETACNVWKNTHDARLKQQMDRMMFKLINTQLEDGYLGTYTPNDYWTSWDVWSHKYNLHGLLTYYATTGYAPALEVSKKMGDLLCRTFGKNKKAGQRDILLAGEHVGMAATSVLDAMVDLYRYTGDTKYLDFCYYILDAWEQDNGPKIISRLLATGKVNKVGNGKAYEMISNFVGLTKLYRLTGDEKLLKPLLIAWQDIVDKKLYITGSTSSMEYFQEDNVLPAADKDHIGEGCVTTTWLQFNQNLLAITGDLKYLEQIEKSIYNHLLAAENPETGCVSYYTPLMDKKPYTCFITCCQSSVPRGIALVPNFTFGNVKNVPTLMLYEPANYKETITTVDKKSIDVSLNVATNFPENGEVFVTVNVSKSATFPLAFRVPSWCTSFVAKIGNKTYNGVANEYLNINRKWKTGEKVMISFKMPLQILRGGESYPNQVAVQRGPQVLAFDDALNTSFPKVFALESAQNNLSVETINTSSNSVVLPKQWIGKQAYSLNIIDKENNNAPKRVVVVPFADASQTGGTMKVWLPMK